MPTTIRNYPPSWQPDAFSIYDDQQLRACFDESSEMNGFGYDFYPDVLWDASSATDDWCHSYTTTLMTQSHQLQEQQLLQPQFHQHTELDLEPQPETHMRDIGKEHNVWTPAAIESLGAFEDGLIPHLTRRAFARASISSASTACSDGKTVTIYPETPASSTTPQTPQASSFSCNVSTRQRQRQYHPQGPRTRSQRDKNRVAANKYRQKSLISAQELQLQEQELASKNRTLKQSTSALKEELFGLKGDVLRHAHCDCKLIGDYIERTARNFV